jgi:hypothetical protein
MVRMRPNESVAQLTHVVVIIDKDHSAHDVLDGGLRAWGSSILMLVRRMMRSTY